MTIMMDEALTCLAAMRRQEESYTVAQSLYQAAPEANTAHAPLDQQPVDVDCRNKMVAWCYQVVDFCKFSRETVEIAINYLDRYLTTTAGQVALRDRKVFQLAAMTCLYTAAKMYEPECMDPKLVSNLSRGTYTCEQVESMEASILMALSWKMNPPTALSFVRQSLELLVPDMDEHLRETVMDITKYQTELAVSSHDFLTVPASVIAYSALMNSLESVNLDSKLLTYLSFVLAQAMGLEAAEDCVLEVQDALYQAVVQQPAASGIFMSPPSSPHKSQTVKMATSAIEVSPRSSISAAQ